MNILNKIKNESGATTTFMFLVLVPLFFLMIIALIDMTDSVTTSDIDVQGALSFSAKMAASAIDPESQAENKPRIDPEKANQAFQKSLMQNLGVPPEYLGVSDSDFVGTENRYEYVKYWLIIYNGDDSYTGSPCKLYIWDNSGSVPISSDLPCNDLAGGTTFSISSTGINIGSYGDYNVKLKDTPGVIALVEVKAINIVGNEPMVIQRWSSAKVVRTNQVQQP